MGVLKDFRAFFDEYKVIGLAVAFVIAQATTDFVKSLINDIVMPVITPFIPEGGWSTATWHLGPIVLNIGSFIGALLRFSALCFVIFFMLVYLTKPFRRYT